MRKYFYSFLMGLVLALVLVSCHSQSYSDAEKKSNVLLDQFLKVINIPGLSAAVAIDDKVVYSNSFGVSDIDNNVPATDSTKYRIGSVAKLLTAAATVKLIEKKVIKKDDRIQTYIRGLPEAYHNITIDQLAGHTAGIRHYTREEIASTNSRTYTDLEDVLDRFVNDSLLAKPGE